MADERIKNNYLIGVDAERILSAREQFDYLVQEFGNSFDPEKYAFAFSLAGKLGRRVRFVSLRYRTEDPAGKSVIASGLMAVPVRGRFRGVIEVSPISKEKPCAGSVCNYTVECLPSVMGYVVLVPDTIGYGATSDEPIAFLMSDNVARVSADLRKAAAEYLASLGNPRKLPSRSIVFGYSLGAPGALATANYYGSHPECQVRVKLMYLTSGAYDPAVSLANTLRQRELGYMIYPSICLSLNRWKGLQLDYGKLLIGRVRKDFDRITNGSLNLLELARVYGTDITTYLHPDFFTPEQNPDIRRLRESLSALKVPSDGFHLPRRLKIYLRQSVIDTHVPVACADVLREELRTAGYSRVRYYRDTKDTHFEEAAKSFMHLFLLCSFPFLRCF